MAVLSAGALIASFLLGVVPGAASARDGVLPPHREHFGTTYADLAGEWWIWAGQFPLADNPILEDGDVDCSRGQEGKIWFLAGNFGGGFGEANPAVRTCRIPSGKALFFPIANSLFWVPDDGPTVEDARRLANNQVNTFTALDVDIDGVAVQDPFAYRAQSPPGGFSLPFGPLLADFGYGPDPDPRGPAVADGYWILVSPLARGDHEIHITSSAPGFTLDVTYLVTVGRRS
jgi:hypothetical protein